MVKCKDCKKRAYFGILGSIALYCNEHKKENMISMTNNKCQSSKCTETPIFGLHNKKVQYFIVIFMVQIFIY